MTYINIMIEFLRITVVAYMVYGAQIYFFDLDISLGKIVGVALILRFIIEPPSLILKEHLIKYLTRNK